MVTTTTQDDTLSTTSPTAFELPSLEDATQQLRELNERMVRSSKSAALVALDTFEKALHGVGDLEKKAASATNVDWISAAASSHTAFVNDVSAPYTSAVRDLLK